MIINIERKPTLSIYYLGSIVLGILVDNDGEQIESLFKLTMEVLQQNLHVDFLYYTLDWLYMLSLIKIENGRVLLCT